MNKVALLVSSLLILISSPATAGTLRSEGETASVHIVKGSTINLVARESNVPIEVTNDLPGEVRVIVNLRSNSPKLSVLKDQIQLVLPAGTTDKVKFPVRAIGSGNVILVAWLTSLDGNELGSRVPITMVANPDIEGAAIVLFLGFVAVLIAVGIRRTIRRRRGI